MLHIRSIKIKLTLFFGMLLLVICLGFGAVAYLESSNMLKANIDDTLPQMADQAANVIRSKLDIQLNALDALAGIDIIKGNDLSIDEKLELISSEAERSGYLRIGIADPSGKVRYTDGEILDISDRAHFKKAISGKSAVSDPIVSKVDNSIVMSFAVPIKDGDKIVGVLVGTRDGNELSTYTNDIQFGKSGSAYMINDKCTTIAHQNPELVKNMDNTLENIKKDPGLESLAKLEKEMMAGKNGVGQYEYNGVTKYMAYTPIQGTTWSLAITAPESEVMEKVRAMGSIIIVISIGFILLGVIFTFLIASRIAKPIKAASDHLKIVSSGDFSKAVTENMLKSNDEIGTLANAIETMQQSIRKIVRHVIDGSLDVGGMLDNINNGMDKLNKSIEGITATTEELSAGTEETASSTEEMNATSLEISEAVCSIASKAQVGSEKVSNVSKMAEDMKNTATISKGNAVEIYGRTKNDLQDAIEQAKAVSQINELSEAILDITNQTNLLALNAAIEAARAGEAGKGFAVVAEEIRKLAEDSKNTVTRIQNVTKIIFEAVGNLTSSSGEILEFIDKQVSKDYDYLVEASEQYSVNTSAINDMVTDFSATSEELLASIDNMTKAINEIAGSANEEAQGASNIAQEASDIAQLSNEVIKLSEAAKTKSDSLINAVSIFKV